MHNLNEIVCEGLTDRCLCALRFRGKKDKDFHQATYCECHYDKCEFYQMLMDKYPDE